MQILCDYYFFVWVLYFYSGKWNMLQQNLLQTVEEWGDMWLRGICKIICKVRNYDVLLKLNWTLWGCHYVVLAFNVVFKITFRPQSRYDVTRKCIFSLMRESNIWSLPDNLYWVFQDPRSFWTCFHVFPRYIHCIILQVVKFESSTTSHTTSRSWENDFKSFRLEYYSQL